MSQKGIIIHDPKTKMCPSQETKPTNYYSQPTKKVSLYCEAPFTSVACSLDVLHASGGDTLTKGTTSHQNMSLNMH